MAGVVGASISHGMTVRWRRGLREIREGLSSRGGDMGYNAHENEYGYHVASYMPDVPVVSAGLTNGVIGLDQGGIDG